MRQDISQKVVSWTNPFSISEMAFLGNRKEKEIMKHSYRLPALFLASLMLVMVPFTLSAQSSENMTFLGNWGGGGGEIRAVTNFGDLVYYGIGNQFVITSFEDPANPFTASSVMLDDMVEDIVWKVNAGVTYALVSGSSLNIINVTNPLAPSLVSTTELSGYGEGLGVSGDYAYVAVGSAGMEVIDISNPASPTSVAVVAGSGSGYAEGINVAAPRAYLGNGANVTIFDISTPTNPTIEGTFEGSDWVQDVMVLSTYMYVCEWGVGIEVVDISTPASPVLVTTFSNPRNADIMFDGNFAYIASREYGITILDVTDAAAPIAAGTFTTDGVVRKVSFGSINLGGTQTGHVFAAEVSLISAINVSDPGNMAYSGARAVPSPADGLCYSAFLDGNIAYLAYQTSIRAIDISSPAGMSELGNHAVLAGDKAIKKVVVKDDILFAACKTPGLQVIDFTDPANPDSLTTLIASRTNDVAISGDYVYAATNDFGIGIINASTANAPTFVGYIPESVLNGRYGEGVAAYGNTMAQSTWGQIFFYDISSPEAPVLTDSVTLVTGSSWLTMDDNYAYVHDFDSLRIYDISNLSDVVQVSSVFTDGSWDGDAFREGDYVYANCETNGLKVFNVTDISAPTLVASFDMLNSARGIIARNGLAYVAEKEGGFSIYRNELLVAIDPQEILPTTLNLQQNYPNPFNPSTMIQFSIPQAMNAELVKMDVYNVLGQNIRTLVNRNLEAGSYQILWNGLNSNGQLVPAGMYIYRLESAGQVISNKMVLIK